jgi:hypothetical protein
LSVQIVVSDRIAECGAVRTEGGMKRAGGLGCNRPWCFVDAAQSGVKGVGVIVARSNHSDAEAAYDQDKEREFFMFEFSFLPGLYED